MEKMKLICPYCRAGGNEQSARIVNTKENFSVIRQVSAEYPVLICFSCGNASYFNGASLLSRIPDPILSNIRMNDENMALMIDSVRIAICDLMRLRLFKPYKYLIPSARNHPLIHGGDMQLRFNIQRAFNPKFKALQADNSQIVTG